MHTNITFLAVATLTFFLIGCPDGGGGGDAGSHSDADAGVQFADFVLDDRIPDSRWMGTSTYEEAGGEGVFTAESTIEFVNNVMFQLLVSDDYEGEILEEFDFSAAVEQGEVQWTNDGAPLGACQVSGLELTCETAADAAFPMQKVFVFTTTSLEITRTGSTPTTTYIETATHERTE